MALKSSSFHRLTRVLSSGLAAHCTGTLLVANSTLVDNDVLAVAISDSVSLELDGCTIARNAPTSSLTSAVFALMSGRVVLRDTLVFGHRQPVLINDLGELILERTSVTGRDALVQEVGVGSRKFRGSPLLAYPRGIHNTFLCRNIIFVLWFLWPRSELVCSVVRQLSIWIPTASSLVRSISALDWAIVYRQLHRAASLAISSALFERRWNVSVVRTVVQNPPPLPLMVVENVERVMLTDVALGDSLFGKIAGCLSVRLCLTPSWNQPRPERARTWASQANVVCTITTSLHTSANTALGIAQRPTD